MPVPELTPLFNRVVIAGVGLIGGSVALGLKQRFLAKEVIGYDSNPINLNTALGLGVVDSARLEPGDWLKETDVLVLAVPVGGLATLAAQLMPFVGPRTIVTDVGSVKAGLSDSLALLPANARRRFVPGHPMAGSEKGGVEHASAALLENAIWVLTPTPDTDSDAIESITQMVAGLGAKPIQLDPRSHDRLVAMVSHLPYLSALALTRSLARHEDRDGLAILAAGGFRDLTRVASGDPRMSRDMVVENKQALREALSRYRAELESLEAMLFSPEMLLDAATEGKRMRDSLPVVRRTLFPALHELVIAIPDKPGQLARITSLLGEANINITDIEVLTVREQGGALRLGFRLSDEALAAKPVLEAAGYEVRVRG